MHQGDHLRIWYTPERKTKRTIYTASYTIKCGCCNETVKIADFGNDLEINGVITSKKNWRDFLAPLLKEEK